MTPDQAARKKLYQASHGGDLTTYAGMIGDEFASRVDRVSQLIGKAHHLSVGQYKESILRSLIRSYLPRRYSVASGFILFPRKSRLLDLSSKNLDLWNLREHELSKQLDVIVFDDLNYPPVLQDDGFVVLRPESVRSVIEVKGFLNVERVEKCVDLFIDLGKKWVRYQKFSAARGRDISFQPRFQLIGWAVKIDVNGNVEIDGTRLQQTIAKRYM